MFKNSLILVIIFAIISCNNKNEKKIIVLNKGTAIIDEKNKKIVIKDGDGNEEHELLYSTNKKITIEVLANNKSFNTDFSEVGYYILNAKNDTIIGSLQNYTDPTKPNKEEVYISQEMIKKSIDSLTALTEGKKINSANKNFYILPYTALKITSNIKATIIAPYHNIRSIEQVNNEEPEVYRFYSINEIREKIEKQKALTQKK